MEQLVDRYLNHLQEGIWSAITKALEFPTAKHPKYRMLIKSLNNRYIMCRTSFPAVSDKKIKFNSEWGNIDYKDYQESPEYITCIDNAYLDFVKDFIKWASKMKPEEVCKYNRNKERCMKWLENEVLGAKADLKDLTRQMQQMKSGRMNRSAFNKFQNRLYLKGPKK